MEVLEMEQNEQGGRVLMTNSSKANKGKNPKCALKMQMVVLWFLMQR